MCRSSAAPCPARSLRASCSATSAAHSPARSSTKKGLIESADGGTLFLDEIGDLGVELQTRLFRFVEERALRRLGGLTPVRVDCRILCATNQDLPAKIKAGTFREELLLPAERGHGEAAATARKAGGHSAPGALLSGAFLAALRQEPVRFAAIL